jgi:predicted molibdopterin-dependent oxidoreductase YjgC
MMRSPSQWPLTESGVLGANPTDAHPVFASRMKKRLREGAKLIVIDPRRIDLVRMPHVEAIIARMVTARCGSPESV